jgi:hypothetical protein
MNNYGLPGATAGLLGFAPEHGGLKATVIPADAHPAGAGLTVLRFVRQLVKDHAVTDASERVSRINVHFPEAEGDPDPEEIAALKRWAAPGTNPDWPVTWWTLLAKTLGDPDAILTAGHMASAHEFAVDSLHCEWGYVVNFADQVIEVYRGYQTEPPTAGRWAGEEFPEDRAVRDARRAEHGRDFYAINEVARLPFGDLPTDEAFLTHLDHLL